MAGGGATSVMRAVTAHLVALEPSGASRKKPTRTTIYLHQEHKRSRAQPHLRFSHAGDRLLRSTAVRSPSTPRSTKKTSFEAVTSGEVNSIEGANGFDVAILSNGPGEVSSWVRPVVKALERTCEEQGVADLIRISVS